MELNTLLYLAIMIFSGMACGRLAKLVHLPNVTGYLVAGLIIGPSVLGIIPEDVVSGSAIISDIALGCIAFSIGSEFKVSYFRKVGTAPIVIALLEALMAVLFVLAALLIAGEEWPFALVLSSIAAATAPAATIMVVKQYRAKGPVTEMLLSVVALDDAAALMLFGIAVAAQSAANPGGSVLMSLLNPLWEIFGSLICGFVLGMLLAFFLRFFRKDGNRLSLTLGFVFCGAGLANLCGFSPLLLCMALGAGLGNLSKQSLDVMRVIDGVTPPIFMLFFVDSGAGLRLDVLPSVGLVGLLYIVFRVGGKIAGASLGALLCRCDKHVTKYLGPALLPQAGVAIGLSLAATTVVPQYGAAIRAVVLCATLIYELIGPAVTKLSLGRAGELEQPKKPA